ncbi:hypothetical protein RCL1_008033 [Eukaryota sp. TZLM3-RCL]
MTSLKCKDGQCSVLLSDFEELEELNAADQGSQGDCLLLKEKSTSKLYFMKTLGRRSTAANEELKYFLKPIDSPFLIKYLHCFEESLSISFVMDYCEGGSLFRFLQDTLSTNPSFQFSDEDISSIIVQILSGLRSLHEANIMHRDLKLANILLVNKTRPYRIKLCDFGISKNLENTRGRTFVGTPGYIAPEVLNGSTYGFSVDYFALGAVLYELTEKKAPFELQGMLPNFSKTLQFSSSNQFKDIIKGLLAINPAQRFSFDSLMTFPLIRNAFKNCVENFHPQSLIEFSLIELQEVVKQQTTEIEQQKKLVESLRSEIKAFAPLRDQHASLTRELSVLKKALADQKSEFEAFKNSFTSPTGGSLASSTSNSSTSSVRNNSMASYATKQPEQRQQQRPVFRSLVDLPEEIAKNEKLCEFLLNCVREQNVSDWKSIRKLKISKEFSKHTGAKIRALGWLEGVEELDVYCSGYLSDLCTLNKLKVLTIGSGSTSGLQYFPLLKVLRAKECSVDFHDFSNLHDLEELRLERVNFSRDSPLNDFPLIPKLRILHILDTSFNSPPPPAQLLSSLEECIFSGGVLQSKDLSEFQNLQNLKIAEFRINFHGNNSSNYTPTTAPKLKILTLHGKVPVEWFNGCPALEELTWPNPCITTSIAPLQRLKKLFLIDLELGQRNFSTFALLTNLEYFELHFYCCCSRDFFVHLTSWINLKVLKLVPKRSCHFNRTTSICSLSMDDFALLSKLVTLDELHLHRFDSPNLSFLTTFPNLLHVDFSNNSTLSDVSQLSSCSKLKSVNLSECTSLVSVQFSCPLLESLNLAKCTALRSVDVPCTRLKCLYLENCSLISSLNFIKSASNLEVLVLSGCIRCVDLDFLLNFQSLKKLWLPNNASKRIQEFARQIYR